MYILVKMFINVFTFGNLSIFEILVIFFKVLWNVMLYLGYLAETCLFSVAHKSLIIFKSGDWGGQSLRRHSFFWSKYAYVTADLWHGTLSCMNISPLSSSSTPKHSDMLKSSALLSTSPTLYFRHLLLSPLSPHSIIAYPRISWCDKPYYIVTIL